MNIPNNLTIIRLSLIPIFVVVFYLPGQWRYLVTATIFFVAALTDWLDGYLARRLHQESTFGEFLDPVADKLIVAVALVLLVQRHGTPFLAIPAAIIISREIAISALREWMAELGKRASVAVSWLGKVKTVLQMVAIIFLLSQEPRLENKIILGGYALLYVAAIITLWTMVIYLRAAWKDLASDNP
jgi:CDP-diacylglycerol---glycerol-3-phosphate 3-phosphatidyltransferase